MAKATRKSNKKGLSKPALVIIGVLITVAITIVAVALYVFIYSFSYIHGDLKIDLKEYRYTQNQTSFVYAYNKKSLESQKSCGLTITGRIPEYRYYNNSYHDLILMTISREEFYKKCGPFIRR